MSIHVRTLMMTPVLFLNVFININEIAAVPEGCLASCTVAHRAVPGRGSQKEVNSILNGVKGGQARCSLFFKQSSVSSVAASMTE